MTKKCKSYRLSKNTIIMLEHMLKDYTYETETEIIEDALFSKFFELYSYEKWLDIKVESIKNTIDNKK